MKYQKLPNLSHIGRGGAVCNGWHVPPSVSKKYFTIIEVYANDVKIVISKVKNLNLENNVSTVSI